MKVCATTDRHESMMCGLLMSYRKSGFLMMFTQNRSSRLLHFHVCTTSGSIFRLYFRAASSRKSNRYFITGGMLLLAVSNVWKKSSMYFFNVPWNRKHKRSVMITQEMCPIREEISTHKNFGKCIYLLFVWLAVIGFRQNYFYLLPYFGDFVAKMSFFHYIINQKRNNFIKHCPPPPPPVYQEAADIRDVYLYKKFAVQVGSWYTGGGGGGGKGGGERCSIDKK